MTTSFLPIFSIRVYTVVLLLSLAFLVPVFENIEVSAQRGPGPLIPRTQPAPSGHSFFDESQPLSNSTAPTLPPSPVPIGPSIFDESQPLSNSSSPVVVRGGWSEEPSFLDNATSNHSALLGYLSDGATAPSGHSILDNAPAHDGQ